jgi:MATE family multidrug resistance protein
VRIFSAPAALTNLVLLGWMLGMQNAKGPMWHLIFTNIINITLDLLFVFGFGWGVKGVAAASVIADYSGVLIGFYFVKQIANRNGIHFDSKALRVWHQWQQIKPLLLINRDIFLRTFALMVCFAFMTFEGAKLGDSIVAANAILQNLLMLVAFGLEGIAYAVEALVGKAVGRKSRAELQKSIVDATFWSLIFALFYSLAFWQGGEPLVHLMSDIPEVVETTLLYLPWIMVMPLISMWCFLFDGIFIGLTRAKDMRNSMFVSTAIGFFLVWYLMREHGNHALWAAMTGFMAMRGLTLALRLRSLFKTGELWH